MREVGRPEKPIDWQRVDELLEAGCSGTEIAPHFNIHPDTLYLQCQKKFGTTFTDYSAERKQKGDSCLKERQYKKALKGDNSMLIWLGKIRLGQRETTENLEFNLVKLMKLIESGAALQKETLDKNES